MTIVFAIAVPVSVALIISIVMSNIYKDTEKQDKGVVLNYHRLTYRRRFIRDLWTFPYAVILFLIMYWFSDLTFNEYLIIGAIFFFAVLIDTIYNYVKWQNNEKDA
ncbi:hypothetical protein [Alkalibacillus salilacus]|uniref:Uncharacterized protein n=1 Tax=Alkalibacillus salilacus TaxID=284582 RepID=A0ABT9VG52_9BACI|nr:hypothetical protein [Alkalibacillus salilacus]MDQ0159954.1 hypothetical protein [Alkalibacillus salilacus]